MVNRSILVNVEFSGGVLRYLVIVLFLCSLSIFAQETGDLMPGDPGPSDADPGETPTASPEETPESTEEDPRSALDEWRDTLRFGINSEMLDLLPELRENAVRELAQDVEDVARRSENSAVLAEAVRYFLAIETYPITDRVYQLLEQYRDRPPEFAVDLTDYLEAADAAPSEEQRAILFDMVEDSNVLRARAAVELLGRYVEDTAVLIDLYRDTDLPEDTRGAILVALGDRGDPAAFDFVAELIGDDEAARSMIQRYAIDTLGRLGDERAIPIILRQLDSGDATTRSYAVHALRRFETEEATRAILDSLRDDFWRVRVAALETIAERSLAEATDAVIYKARRDPEEPVRLAAIAALEALDRPEGWEALRESVASRHTGLAERARMIVALIENDYAASEETLLELVVREWEVRNSPLLDAIGRTVSTTETVRTERLVERLITHPNYIIQIYAIRAVGTQRIHSLREVLEERSREEGNHRAVRSEALRALEQLSAP